MLNRTRTIILAGIIGACPTLLMAQSPTTVPSAVTSGGLPFNAARMPVRIHLKRADGVQIFSRAELSVLFSNVNFADADINGMLLLSDSALASPESTGNGLVDADLRLSSIGAASGTELPGDAAERGLNQLTNELKKRLKFDSSIPTEQRIARIKQLEAEERDLSRKISALNVLNDVQSNAKNLLNEKLSQLRAEAQRLEMDRAAKEARRKALMVAVEEQQHVTKVAQATDAIATELQNLVKLREAEATRKKQMFAAGQVPQAEMAAVDAQISEAKIRLAEREAQLGKAGKGELLDRLSDELAMVSVDVTETELRLQQVRSDLRMYDARFIDADGLNRVILAEPVLRTDPEKNNLQSLTNDYYSQLPVICAERLKLKAMDVEVTRTGSLQPGGRGGRGGGALPPGGGRRGGTAPQPQQ